ncbi:MAG: MopE-related protein [Deltaproteobacteria bacterium]|nr:MopE-related protein [Deltaproteobacteria bacterium]
MNRVLWLPCLLLALAGCEMRSYSFYPELPDGAEPLPQGRPDGSTREAGPDVSARDTLPTEVGTVDVPAGCVPSKEECNGQDDDCDGLIDEDFEFNTDPLNCGRCGNVCGFPSSETLCSAARCKLNKCAPGFVDLDRLDVNGCECQITNAGQELCDGKDNNCDGLTDEGFDFEVDAQNCGGCGQVCSFANAGATCAAATCQMQACKAGFIDLDKAPQNGCEYGCVPGGTGVEVCDGKDNNCDGQTDESDPLAGKACFPDGVVGCNPQTGACGGGCALGTWACLPGGLVCQNAKLPEADVCDGKDNDCDGKTDEDFDLANDPRWCGGCGITCALPNAINGCSQSQCTVAFCKAGFVDLDRAAVNGCEYACTPDGPEVCDGKDNDCDGKTDEADNDLKFPPNNFCLQIGECGQGAGGSSRYPNAGSFPVCTTAPGAATPDWYCNYPASVQLFAPNQVLGQESWCDGLDNDCDGEVDEHTQPRVGSACKDDGLGECQKTGVLRCQADRTLSPACDVSAAPNHVAAHETCDAKDNDCDGLTDESWDNPAGGALPTCGGVPCEGARDEAVHVTTGGYDYYIYKYEAARSDATATDTGSRETRACASAGKRPWTSVNHLQAQRACEGAGMRLCQTTRATSCSSSVATNDEWGWACATGLICPNNTAQPYPYACTYDAAACHGADVATGEVAVTGSFSQCVSPDLDAAAGAQQAFDMSGNVAEWTEDCRGVLADGRKTHTLRGGSYLSIPRALQCDFTATVVGEDFAFVDTGFRCCSSCPPGTADCGGTCINLSTDAKHCGACGTTCGGGQTCSNGVCR